jgi:NTP pyrophosphatase (non-canonical NTP hydrolase)
MSSKPPKQSDVTFEEISQRIWQHLYERDWHKNPSRGLAISIALEANELLEHYQWQNESVGNNEELAEELADIFIYAFEFAHAEGIDIPAAIENKLQKAAKKYPAKNFKGKTGEERNQAWLQSKLNHRKTGL